MFIARTLSLLALTASLLTAPALATTYPLPPAGSRLIGELEDYIVQPDEHLELIGKHTQIGFWRCWKPIRESTPICPSRAPG